MANWLSTLVERFADLLHRAEGWPRQSEAVLYDSFVSAFAQEFYSENKNLYGENLQEYLRQFNKRKENEWHKAKYNLKK